MSETRNSETPKGMTSEPQLPGSAGLSGGGVAAIVIVFILLLLLGVGISVIAWRKRRGKTPEDYTSTHTGTALNFGKIKLDFRATLCEHAILSTVV